MEITEQDIEELIKQTENRGKLIFEYLEKYKGQPIYNEIALATQFGYHVALEEQNNLCDNKKSRPRPLADKIKNLVHNI